MDIKTASVKELYCDMSEKWEILSELFSKQDERGKPRLALFNIDYGNNAQCENTFFRRLKFFAGFECMPGRIPFEDKKDIFETFLKYAPIAGYNHYYNLIAINRQAMPQEDYEFAMPEEVTHSIVQIKEDIIPVDAIATAAFNGYSSYFGHKIHSALKLLGIEEFDVEIDEFFPPLGQIHILGKDADKYKCSLDDAVNSKTYFQPEKTKEERAKDISGLVCYLPALAGFMLVRQYKNDVRALLREHPSLTNLDGQQVWESYCKPLLMHGKL